MQLFYVYFLRSVHNPEKTYIGFTSDISQRLNTHNLGQSVHTAKYRPWNLVTYVAFDSEQKAQAFEKYSKVGSGNAFVKKKFF